MAVAGASGRRRRPAVRAELGLVEARVDAAPVKQRLMTAGLFDDALIEHINSVGVNNGREPMSDDDCRSVFGNRLKRALDRPRINELIDYQGFCAGPKALSDDKKTTTSNDDLNGRTMDEAETEDTVEAASFQNVQPKDCMEKLVNGWSPSIGLRRCQWSSESFLGRISWLSPLAPETLSLGHLVVASSVFLIMLSLIIDENNVLSGLLGDGF